jgi:hypothetical protein
MFFGVPANGFDHEERPATRIITKTEAMQVVLTRQSAICGAMPDPITIIRLLENRKEPTVLWVKPHKLQAACRPTAFPATAQGVRQSINPKPPYTGSEKRYLVAVMGKPPGVL